MPGEQDKPETPAGKSGLDSEKTSEGQTQDQNMNPGGSSVTAAKLPHQEPPSEEKGNASELSNAKGPAWKFTDSEDPDAALKAFNELYGMSPLRDSPPTLGKDPLPGESESIDVDKDGEAKDKEDEEEFLCPESRNFAPGTAEDLTEKLRFNGLAWRHELRRRAKTEPNLRGFLLWMQNRPSPMNEGVRPLGSMLHDLRILRGEVEQMYDMGDGFMQMPIALFEQHVYPSAFLRSYLQGMGDCGEGYQAGVETTLLYAFHMQYQVLPAEYTSLDLQLLRASSLHAADDLRAQVTDSSEMVTGLSVNASNTLDKLEEECQLPNFRAVQNWSRPDAEARTVAVKKTLGMYRKQAKHDYQLLRTTKEKNIYLAKLTASQAIENLVLIQFEDLKNGGKYGGSSQIYYRS